MGDARDFVENVRKLSAERQAQQQARALAAEQAARSQQRQAQNAAAERLRRAHELYDPVVSRLAELVPLVAGRAVAKGLAPDVTCSVGRWRRKVSGWRFFLTSNESGTWQDSPDSFRSTVYLVLGRNGRLYGYKTYSLTSKGGSSSSEEVREVALAGLVSWAITEGVEGALAGVEAQLTRFAVQNALW